MPSILHVDQMRPFHPDQLRTTNILIKRGGFNPSPIAGRIPKFANVSVNPDVRGTPLYEEFWQEQVDRCLNGYTTGGLRIPGRHYYYMNFQPISGVTGAMYPLYCEFDREFYSTVDWVKEYHHTGIVILKARRKGLSEKVKGGVINYGLTFQPAYRAAVFAGIDTYVQGIKKKIMYGLTETVDDMRMGILKNNEKQLKLGYEERIFGSFVEAGSLAEVQFETMFNGAEKLEGEYFHDVVSEESGENPHVLAAFESIKPALMFGAQMVGTFYIYGTAGNILSGSKDFIEMYRKFESYDLIPMWVPGTRLYFPFVVQKKNPLYFEKELDIEIDPIKNLRELVDEYGEDRLLGCEDLDNAEENVKRLYKKYEHLDDKKQLIELKKNFPLSEDDAITSGGSNDFNTEILYARLNQLQMNSPRVGKYVLDFVYEKDLSTGDSRLKLPLEVKIRLAEEKDPEWKIVRIRQMPLRNMRNVDAMGVDSYNQDKTNTSSSLGGIVVLRDGKDIPSVVDGMDILRGEYPVCWYQERPPRKEIFYEMALKIAVLYGLYRDCMISAEHDFCIDYFKKNGGRAYLAPRPRSFDSPNTEALYDYGAKFNINKKRIVGIIQSWIEDYAAMCDSEILVRELIAFDEVNMGSDWDIVDALGYAKMRMIDRKAKPTNVEKTAQENQVIEWERTQDGHAVIKNGSSKGGDDVIFFGNRKVQA